MKTINKDIVREMKKSHLRFIYITAIIALGIAFFTGLKATAPSMEETARVYFEETKLADLHLQSDYGFKDSDLTELTPLPVPIRWTLSRRLAKRSTSRKLCLIRKKAG